jgi:predicted PolB exonuclease-like 3'-5' exonuclease
MIDEGRVQEVRDYCETDVLNTYLVYLRHQMHTGILSVENYNRCIADVISMIETTKEDQPNRGEFLKAWGEACGNEFTV